MNCLFTCNSRCFSFLRSKTLFQIILFLGLLVPFSNVNAQGQLLDVYVDLVSVSWAGDVWCGDGTVDPTGGLCINAGNDPDIRFKYRIGYGGSNFSSYKYLGSGSSPTTGGPTLDGVSDTDGRTISSNNFNVNLTNVCGSVTFDVEAWEEDGGIVVPFTGCPNDGDYEYNSSYPFNCSVALSGGDDVRRTGTSNAPISANTNLAWTVNLEGDYFMNFSLLATRVAAPSFVSGTTTICSGGSTTLTSSSAESGTVIRWYTNPSNPNGSVVGDGNSITVSPSATTTYYFAQYKNDCIGLSRAQTVTVVADPTAPSITRNSTSSTVCEGTSLTVNTSGGSGGTGTCNNQYRYSTNGGSNYSNWSTTVPSFSAVTGTNIVQSRRNCNGSGCGSNVNSVTWTVEANPGPQTVNATTCIQSQAGTVVTTATNAAGCSYQVTTITTWVGQADETVNVTSCNQADAGTVTVQQTNAAGCTYNVTTVTTWIGQADETVNLTTCNQADAGTVVTTETNAAGCSYDVYTVTTWVGQDDETLEVTTCDANEVGTVVTTETNAAGCPYELTTITTLETVPPTASCQNLTAYLDASGVATVGATDVDNGSSDNCGIASMTLDVDTWGCTLEGSQQTVTLTVTDVNGNSSTCTAQITIDDILPPTAGCEDITVYLDSNGTVSIDKSDIENGSTDNCGWSNALSIDKSDFNCSNVGENTVTLLVGDGNGNQASCTSTVTVVDNIAPVLVCQDVTVYLGANGQTSNTNPYLNGMLVSESDNCSTVGGVGVTGPRTYTCNSPTTVTVKIIQDDPSGNESNCTAILTILDTIVPVASCKDVTIELPASLTYDLLPSDIDDNSSDNCALTYEIIGQTFFDCDDIGTTTTVTLEVTDTRGNKDNCTADVTIIEGLYLCCELPIATCQNTFAYLDQFGLATITAADVDGGSYADCGLQSLDIDVNQFSCADLFNPVPVALTITDINNESDQCVAIVTVVDTIAPTLVCPASFTVNTDEGICGALIDATLLAPISATDNCLVSLKYSYAGTPIGLLPTYFGSGSGDLPSVTVYTGSADFSYEMTDYSGNSSSCSFTVTVNDLEPPVLTCPDDITVFTDPGVCGAKVEYVVTFSDNCPSQTKLVLTGGLGSASLFPTGTSTESYGYSDYSGNGTACSFTITVIDNELPVLECPDDITVDTDPGICAAFIAGSLTNPVTATDNCASTLEYSLSGNPYGLLPTYFAQGYGNLGDVSISGGSADVEYTLTDASGNNVNCSFTITVDDNELPVITCPSDITVDTDPGECSAVINYAIGLSENCPIFNFPPLNAPQLVSGLGSGEAFPVGSTVNTYSFTDVQGNSNSCSFTITVEDNVLPTAVCQDVTVYLDANGNGSTSASLVDAGSNDACGIAGLSLDNEEFYCEDVTGTNVVTLTVTDNNGNSSACTSNVTVVGILPEVFITEAPLPEFCQGGTIVLTANSDEAIAYAWDTNPVQTTQSIEIDANGTYTVTVTSATGCTEQASYTISDFDAGALLSSYSIIGLDEVHLHNENIVYSGGVGVVNENKKAKLHDNSFVYTFIQAPKIEIDGSSAAANTILAQANVILPAFVTNPYDSNNDVKVNKNTTVVLTDCIYDKVEIDKEATVTFTCDNIYIHELKTKEGVTIKFDGAANLFINKKVKLEKYTKFNPDGLPVRAYIDDKLEVKEGSDVFVNVYASKDINAKGKDKDEAGTNMTGIFIGEKVHGHEAVNWYWNTDCDLLPLPILPAFTKISDGVKDIDNNLVNKIQSAVYPNPFMDKATIEFTVPESNLTSIEIMTIDGKVIQVIELGLLDANTRQLVDFVPEFNQKAGMFIYRIVSGNNYATGNMIFIK
ncbi:MAG: HYR domain-containing protein [Chitinophagales bacterium]